MEHSYYTRLLSLSVYDELTADEQRVLRTHCAECGACRGGMEELKKLHGVLATRQTVPVDEGLLMESRRLLQSVLLKEKAPPPFFDRLFGSLSIPMPSYSLAFGGMALVFIGLFGGYLLFSPPSPVSPAMEQTREFSGDIPRISGLRFIDADATDGEIEFTFDTVTPVRMKGNVNDERIQKVLAHALLNDANPGVRLRSVNAAGSQSLKLPDPELKAALISALKADANPAVRQEALRVLQGFAFDAGIKDAILYALMHDSNAGVRIAAINALDSARVVRPDMDQQMQKVLRDRMETDNNNYVRIRARSVLQEVHNQ